MPKKLKKPESLFGKNASKSYDMDQPGWIGSTYNSWGLLPGATLDYAAMAGNFWECSPVAIALRWIRINISEPPFAIARKKGKKEDLVFRHKLLDLLERPNEGYNGKTLVSALAQDLVGDGNTYIEAVKSKALTTLEIWHRPYFSCSPAWYPGQWVSAYQIKREDAPIQTVNKDWVVHIRDGIDPLRPRLGCSAMRFQSRELLGVNKASTYESALLNNYGVPAGLVFPEDENAEMQNELALRLKSRFNAADGADRAGGVEVIKNGGKFSFVRVGFSPAELSVGDMCYPWEMRLVAACGLNPMVLGLASAKDQQTYSNWKEARRAAYQDCLIPLGKLICEGITQSVLGREFLREGERLVQDWSGVAAIAEDYNQTSTSVVIEFEKNLIKQNEARQRLNYPSEPNGDKFSYELSSGFSQGSPQAEPSPPIKAKGKTKVNPKQPSLFEDEDEQPTPITDTEGEIKV